MTDLHRLSRDHGKTAAIQAQVDFWLAIYGHDPTVETWIAGPEGTLRWNVTRQQWEPVSPPTWGQAR